MYMYVSEKGRSHVDHEKIHFGQSVAQVYKLDVQGSRSKFKFIKNKHDSYLAASTEILPT